MFTQLRASVAFVVPVMRALSQLPPPIAYHLGQPDRPAFDPTDPKAVAVLTVAWLPMWVVTPDGDPTVVVQALAHVGAIDMAWGRGNLREWTKFLEWVLDLAPGLPLDVATAEQAIELMAGKPVALRLAAITSRRA